MSGIFSRVKAEILIFLTIYSGWLLYALSAHLYYEPIHLSAETVMLRMFYMALQTYFVVLLIRFGLRGTKSEDEE